MIYHNIAVVQEILAGGVLRLAGPGSQQAAGEAEDVILY